jgi:hypothetical protein
MLPRRALPLLGLVPLPAAAQAGGWRFTMLRNGDPIGTHRVALSQSNGERIAVSEVSVAPKVLGVVVYRYEHRYTEATRDGRFLRVVSRLNRNGRIAEVSAEASPEAVTIRGPSGTLQMPPNAAPLSWWEPQRFGRVPIFGTSNGQEMRLTFERSRLPDGGTRIQTRGDLEVELRYDAAGSWTGFATRGEDGSAITYAPA